MSSYANHQALAGLTLGKSTDYRDTYDASLLQGVPRSLNRDPLEEELEVISVCNLSGEVCKETLGTRKRTHLASNLAEFLNQLKPLL